MKLFFPNLLFIALAATVAFSAEAPARSALYQESEIAKSAVPRPLDPENVKDAGRIAINSAISELVTNLSLMVGTPKRFAVLPVQNDIPDGYFTLQVRNLFAQRGTPKGLELYARNDTEWKVLLDEIAWGQKFSDTMEPSTVQKFGKIRGVEGLIIGTLSGVSSSRTGEVRVRFNLQAFRVETGQILWSTEKSGVIAVPTEPDSPLALLKEQTWFSKRAAFIAGGVALGLLLLLIVFGRLKAAARPR